ncbi:MAG: enoyl-CoA hydratase/isomerase family protein [Gammaproteobacteria bacterium]|nr:enoyl-CoA hydratase/isomerase family protein [Gammaproteobacteria bacterium]MBP9729217.1 enoyl-CoA hydratase/isomerase family protein [Gammaproteobacteria bacterium]
MDQKVYQHWTYTLDESTILWLVLDRKNARANTLNAEVLQELSDFLNTLMGPQKPRGLVIQSGKQNGFIAGADIDQFKDLKTMTDASQLIFDAQAILAQLEALPFPSLALIDGFCLGGGLELALACTYRIAVEDPKTILGLPEVHLGIHPGWGGTVRLPRLIGPLKALDLILSGRTIDAKTAARMGVVDRCVPRRQAKAAVLHFMQQAPKARCRTLLERGLGHPYLRRWIGHILKNRLASKLRFAHYPAPFIALAHWVQYSVDDPQAFVVEAESVAHLVISDMAKNLGRVFYLKERLKHFGKGENTQDAHVHVMGAGVMGGDIAAWCALKGFRVTLEDQQPTMIASALSRALGLFKKQLKEPHRVQAAMDRLIPDPKGYGVADADLIIEAIVEKVEAKRALFAHLSTKAKQDAVLASNTSTIPLAALSEDPALQKRLIGLHFFNPVAKMPLVEVIASDRSDPMVVEKGLAFVRAIDKLPLPVKSAPGFLVNRILMPYLLEAVLLLESGVPMEAVDQVALDYGMPMGPIELADTVGIDVCLYAAQSLKQEAIPVKLQQLLAAGHLGKKTGRGFYVYNKGKPLKKTLGVYKTPEDVRDRLILSLLNQSVACLREQVVMDADLLDAGLIFGAGFAPFRGGAMHAIVEEGPASLVQRLKLLGQRYGKRFIPDSGWETLF